MRDHELYAAILGVQLPWQVTSVALDPKAEEVRVVIEAVPSTRFPCPQCQAPCPGYDTRRRSFRHLDTCQFKTILEADVPRIQCSEHGVLQIDVPWAEPNSGFTALMEALIIDWLKEASILAVSRRMRLSWDQIDGVMQRAVRRGLARRKLEGIPRSFQSRNRDEPVAIPEATPAPGGTAAYAQRESRCCGSRSSRGLRRRLALQSRVQAALRRTADARH